MKRAENSVILSRIFIGLLVVLITGSLVWQPVSIGRAAPILSIEPLTWNIFGLDDEDMNLGPNTYPIGARVCNSGDEAAQNVEFSLVWEEENLNISEIGPASFNLTQLDATQCRDFYFQVMVNRTLASYNTSREFHFRLVSSNHSTIETEAPTEIYVQPYLNEENQPNDNMSSFIIAGPSTIELGQTVEFTGTSAVASPGMQQLMHLIELPTDLFRIVTVETSYTIPSALSVASNYADACGWNSDITSPTYRSCDGGDDDKYPGEFAGGNTVVTYTVEAIGTGIATINGAVFSYDSDAYIYQPNAAGGALAVTVVDQLPDTETPTPTETHTATATITGTLFTPTETASPTITGTPPTATATLTATITGTPPTATSSPTNTVTGTPPTPTRTTTPTITGTITPNPAITNAVSPSEARTGQNFTFTIRVTNNGSAAATDVTVRSSYSTYETISSANSTKGTTSTSTSTRTVTGNIGTLNPGESATVTVVTRVSTSATSTVTLTNAATVTYRFGSSNFSRTSNSVTYRVTGSSTLPSTGFMELDTPDDGPAVTAALIGGLLALLGFGALLYSMYARQHNPYWTDWFVKTGAVLLVVGLIFGGAAWSLRPIPDAAPLAQQLATPPGDLSRSPYRPNNPPEAPVIDHEFPFPGGPDELESLPEFTIPTPTVVITPAAVGSAVKPPDTSAITRLVIPALGVDNIVKYVPYDGASWLISGLQDEIAWMGDTSWPGLGSNTALAGHVTLRDGSDGPFRYLKDLMYGDLVKVYTEENVYTYQVREQRLVEDFDLSVVAASPESQLTLITCAGWDTEIRLYVSRLVVASDLVEVNSLDRAAAGN